MSVHSTGGTDFAESYSYMGQNKKGVDKNYLHSITAADTRAAESLYQLASARLLDINTWHQTAGKGTAVFQRIRADGVALTGDVQLNDFIRIDIPGPGHHKGFDWVCVEHLSKEDRKTEIRVRPCADPTSKDNSTAHFLSEDATSTFIVEQEGLEIKAIILGRDEMPNNQGKTILEKARDILVGLGAMAGASDVQWDMLTKGILQKALDQAS